MPDNFLTSLVSRNKHSPDTNNQLKHNWNAFDSSDKYSGWGIPGTQYDYGYAGPISYRRPDKFAFSPGTDKTIAVAIYNRLATDTTRARFRHVRVDQNDRFQEEIDSGLNYILNQEANIDQTSQMFIQDLVMSMLDEGVVSAVPVETTLNPLVTGSYDVQTMRVARILSWRPEHVQLEIYNEQVGRKELMWLPKKMVAIIENPFYSVMNEKNSVLQRLMRKLQMLDAIDEQVASGKLDLIIQLPYTIKSQARREQAEQRRQQIEDQLKDTKYGIAYTDGTERITQLNRSVENNLMSQIEYLTSMLYSQLGLTAEIMNGTATESVMLNYYNRTINVILDAIADEFERKFLTKTARSQHQAIKYFRDPFVLATSEQIAEVADKFTRNEIFSPNDMRGVIGFMPSTDPSADELRNRNIAAPMEGSMNPMPIEAEEVSDVDESEHEFVRGLLNDVITQNERNRYEV